MTHPTWELKLDNHAALVLTPCPGTKQLPLVESIAQLKAQGVTAVVTALSQHEMDEKSVGSLPQTIEQAGLQWFHAPIEDDCAPDADFAQRWQQISPALHQVLDNGEK